MYVRSNSSQFYSLLFPVTLSTCFRSPSMQQLDLFLALSSSLRRSQVHMYVCICVCLQLVCASLLVFISIENSLLWQRSWLSSVTTLSEQLADSYSQNQFPLSNQCLSTGSLSKRSSTALTTAQISFSTISTGRDERDSVYLSLFCW